MSGETDLKTLLKSMNPKQHEGDYVFCMLENLDSIDQKHLIMCFAETEGTTVIVRKDIADGLNLKYGFVVKWITLMVHSSLEASGFTAAFSTALASESISCNVIAGYFHDHLFVKKEEAENAMETLRRLSL